MTFYSSNTLSVGTRPTMGIGFGAKLTENGAIIGMERAWRNFIIFLHKEDVYKEYRIEFYKFCLRNSIPIQTHIEYLKNRSDASFIAWSFHWRMTNMGTKFWKDIDQKWRSYRDGTDLD